MYMADRSRMMGMTSSVTATMSSPKVVLMILRGRMMFPRYAAIFVARRRPAGDDELRDPTHGSYLAA